MTVLSERFLRDNRATGDNVSRNFVPWKSIAILNYKMLSLYDADAR